MQSTCWPRLFQQVPDGILIPLSVPHHVLNLSSPLTSLTPASHSYIAAMHSLVSWFSFLVCFPLSLGPPLLPSPSFSSLSLFSHSLVHSAAHYQSTAFSPCSGLFQMPLIVPSLLSTIKASSTIPRTGHILISFTFSFLSLLQFVLIFIFLIQVQG